MRASGRTTHSFILLLTLVALAVLFPSFSTCAQEAPAGVTAAPAATGAGRWHAVTKLVDGQRVIYMRLPPSPAPKDGSSYEFVLRCKTKSTDAYIEWKAFGDNDPHDTWSDEIPVFYSFDGEPGEYAKWGVSADKYVFSIPNPLEFIQSMHDKKALTVIPNARVNPPGDPMPFILKGLEDVLNQLYEGCYK